MNPTEVLRPMVLDDLEAVRSWRNAPEVRHMMRTHHAITADEHREWYARHGQDPARRLWIFERCGQAQGFIHLADVYPLGRASWGFYKVPGAPRGTGKAMCSLALDRSFGPERLSAIEAEVMGHNLRSLTLHEALGFERVNVEDSGLLDDARRTVARHRLILTASAWWRRPAQAS